MYSYYSIRFSMPSVFCVVFWFLAILPFSANAFTIDRIPLPAPSNDFVLSPAKVEVSVAPGETATRSLSVTNRTGGPLSFSVSVEDIEGTHEKETDVLLLGEESGAYSFRDFATPEVSLFTLLSGERITFTVSVSPTPALSGSGLYGAVVVASSADRNAGDVRSGARVVSRIAGLFFVRVAGDADPAGRLLDFRVSGPSRLFYDREPIPFEVLYENDGSVHTVPYGVIEVTNLFGAAVTALPIDPYFALPESTRFRELTWDATRAFGWYEATLRLNRGYDDIIDVRSVTVIVLPWTFALGILLALSVLAAAIRLLYVRREIKRNV